MSFTHRILKTSRLIHLYLGVFTAPMLLFFAITGGLQTFSLHETSRGSDYKPPAWLASAAQLHKKQTMVMPMRRPRAIPPATDATDATRGAPTADSASTGDAHSRPSADASAEHRGDRPGKNLLPMKIFFVLVSLGLLISTLTGIYMAYRYSRRPRLISVILASGIAVPLLLLLF
jgi:hypothetical protein